MSSNNLPSGWEKHYDDTEQAYFYHHKKSDLTTWDPPNSRRHTRVSATGSELPEGWARHLDESSGNYYYESASHTRNTTWTKPDANFENKPSIALQDRAVRLSNMKNTNSAISVGQTMESFEIENPALAKTTKSSYKEARSNTQTTDETGEKFATAMKKKNRQQNKKKKQTRNKIIVCILCFLLFIVGLSVTLIVTLRQQKSAFPEPTKGEILVLSSYHGKSSPLVLR